MIFAKKSLGQNFLISKGIVEKIVEAGELSPADTVLEIGPGKGALTKELLETGAKVIAIEKDSRLISFLHETFSKFEMQGKFDLLEGDALEINPEMLAEKIKGPYKVIANIPYYITGAIIRTFLSLKEKPHLMVLMVQKEVATRIIAKDGKESVLSLSVKAYATPELVVNVSRGNFFPIPNVDSAVIKLSEIRNPFSNTKEEEEFFKIVKTGFSQKRKKLVSNLESVAPKEFWKEKFAALGINENARAEDVGLSLWISLAKITH